MSKKRGRKVRVDFRQNREQPRRNRDWTRRYHSDEERLADSHAGESVRAKGHLSRKRTVIVDDSAAPLVDQKLWRPATVTAVFGLVSRVQEENGRSWNCTVRRVLRTLQIGERSPVTVGDRVWFSVVTEADDPAQREGVIERVEDRRTRLSRRERRGREHTIVANADQLLIVASVARPALKPHLIDRYIVAAMKGGLDPVLCFTKIDLIDADEAVPELEEFEEDAGPAAYDSPAGAARVPSAVRVDSDAEESSGDAGAPAGDVDESGAGGASDDDHESPEEPVDYSIGDVIGEFQDLGYRCILASVPRGDGIDELRATLRGHITVLSGQSGVGKSSLINAVQPGLNLATADVSEENEKGKHTTSHAQLLRLDAGGFVVDTPGIRQFDLWSVEPGELEAGFVEFIPLVPQCRFSDCSHRHEEGCAVIAAVARGDVCPRRYRSYLKMFEEV